MKRLFILLVAAIAFEACSSETSTSTTTETTATKDSTAKAPAGPPQSNMSAALTDQFIKMLNSYYGVKDALVATDTAATDVAGTHLLSAVELFRNSVKTDSSINQVVKMRLDTVLKHTEEMVAIKDDKGCEKKRVHFEPVSDAMYRLVKDVELKNAVVYHQFCPMAFNDKGAYWLSNEEEIMNPYFGKKMLHCGEVKEVIGK